MDANKATNERSGNDDAKSDEIVDDTPRLKPAVIRMRDAMANRQDAIADLVERERALLTALHQKLEAFSNDVAAEDDWVLLTLSPSEKPRFWVDATSHVVIDRDRRTYRFLRDTRLGRIVLRESEDVSVIANAIADYIAERMVERDRAIDGDWLAAVQAHYDADAERKDEEVLQQDNIPEPKSRFPA
ncbi:MAG: hypothetical protein AAGF59_12120, partial [Pseudomonadota bacterium]